MKLAFLSYIYFLKLFSKKTIIYFFIVIIMLIVFPWLIIPYFGQTEAMIALHFDTIIEMQREQMCFMLYNFSPIVICIPLILYYGNSIKHGEEYHYLTGGVNRLMVFTGKIISIFSCVILMYFSIMILYQSSIIIFSFINIDFSFINLLVRLVFNCFIILALSILITSLLSSSLIGLIPVLIYYLQNFINSSLQYPTKFPVWMKIMRMLSPIYIAQEANFEKLNSIFGNIASYIYIIVYILFLLGFSFLNYNNKDL